jgi:hypothetical protein
LPSLPLKFCKTVFVQPLEPGVSLNTVPSPVLSENRETFAAGEKRGGDTALMQAAVSGETEVVKLLQDKGAH